MVYVIFLCIALPLGLAGSFAPLAAAAGYWLAVWYADRQLGGMSGDVAGFSITLGEASALLILAVF